MAVVRAKLKDYIINKYRVAAFLDKLKHNEYIFYEIPGQVFLERMKSPRYNDDNIYFHWKIVILDSLTLTHVNIFLTVNGFS